jgi:hypothetical protein
MLADNIADPATKLRFVEVFRRHTDLEDLGGRIITLTLTDCQQQLEDFSLHTRCNPSHHPEVDQRNPSIIRDEHIPRMRVGMEKTIHQDLSEICAKQLFGQYPAFQFHLGEWTQRGYFFS